MLLLRRLLPDTLWSDVSRWTVHGKISSRLLPTIYVLAIHLPPPISHRPSPNAHLPPPISHHQSPTACLPPPISHRPSPTSRLPLSICYQPSLSISGCLPPSHCLTAPLSYYIYLCPFTRPSDNLPVCSCFDLTVFLKADIICVRLPLVSLTSQ